MQLSPSLSILDIQYAGWGFLSVLFLAYRCHEHDIYVYRCHEHYIDVYRCHEHDIHVYH